MVARMEKTLGRTPMDVEKFRSLAKRTHDIAMANLKKDEDTFSQAKSYLYGGTDDGQVSNGDGIRYMSIYTQFI